jgi:hypothetical protein
MSNALSNRVTAAEIFRYGNVKSLTLVAKNQLLDSIILSLSDI